MRPFGWFSRVLAPRITFLCQPEMQVGDSPSDFLLFAIAAGRGAGVRTNRLTFTRPLLYEMKDMPKSGCTQDYKFTGLVTIKTIQNLVDSFYALTKRGVAVFGVDGSILVHSPGQRLCLDFHRKNSRSAQLCKESDLAITSLIDQEKGVLS